MPNVPEPGIVELGHDGAHVLRRAVVHHDELEVDGAIWVRQLSIECLMYFEPLCVGSTMLTSVSGFCTNGVQVLAAAV